MTRKVDIGAPSLTGKGAELISVAFAGAVYPIEVLLTSHLNFDISLPEIDGMPVLKSVFFAHSGMNMGAARIRDEDQLMRLASSIEQIAELNNLAHPAITIEEINVSDPDSQEVSEISNEPSNDQPASDVTEVSGNDNVDAGLGNAAADDNASNSDAVNTNVPVGNANAADATKTSGKKDKAATKSPKDSQK